MTTIEQGFFASVDSFIACWEGECDKTEQLLKAVPEELWHRELIPGYRTLARLAWHIIQTPNEILLRTGLTIAGPHEEEPVPLEPQKILEAHEQVRQAVASAIGSKWTDETLLQTDDMYGQTWTRSMTLTALVCHLIHHRGQMTVLLRVGGAKVPGLYGPCKEDWAQFGMPAPAV